MQEGAHQETFVKDILLVSRSGGNNLSVPSFMFQISCLLLKSLIKSVTKSLAAAGKNEAWCWQISCSKQKGLAQSCWERSCDPHQDHVGLTTMLLPWITPPRATCDALFSSPYFFSSHLPLVSRSILSSSWAQCSPAKVFPPPSSCPSKRPARRGKILSSTRQIVPKGRWLQGHGCFVQKHLMQAPRHVLLFTKSYFCTPNDPPKQTSQY